MEPSMWHLRIACFHQKCLVLGTELGIDERIPTAFDPIGDPQFGEVLHTFGLVPEPSSDLHGGLFPLLEHIVFACQGILANRWHHW